VEARERRQEERRREVAQLDVERGELDVHLAVVGRRHHQLVVAEDGADLVERGLPDRGDALAHRDLVERALLDALLEREVDARVEHLTPDARRELGRQARADLAR
jgi:hypothetical protein